jgi:uncharacterized protein with GYD domain
MPEPESRAEVLADLFRSLAGRLIGWYLAFGHQDWLVIGEFPDNKTAATAALAVARRKSLRRPPREAAAAKGF